MQSNEAAVAALVDAASGASKTLAVLGRALARFDTPQAAESAAKFVDPLTIAYIGYGVREASQEIAAAGRGIEGAAGEIEWMVQVIGHAGTLEAECVRRFGSDGFPGCSSTRSRSLSAISSQSRCTVTAPTRIPGPTSRRCSTQ